MKKQFSVFVCLVAVGTAAAIDADGGSGVAQYWPQWRGFPGNGVASHATPPIEWSEERNIRWKIELPGKGHGTPIIWDQRVFVTAAVPFGKTLEPGFSGVSGAHDELAVTRRHRFVVMAIDRRDGEIVWERTLREELPDFGGHVTASLASNSSVTDGEHLFAFFGSFGLYGMSLEGTLLWERDLGRKQMMHGHGEGSSPALHAETLVVNWDHEGQSHLLAFDKRTGKKRWKVSRDAVSSWSTPIIVEHGDRPQVIISGSGRVQSYDLASGEVIWKCDGLSVENVVATPVTGSGMVYAGSSYDRQGMLAIQLAGAKGDITGTKQVVWKRARGAPYVPSPLLYGDSLYFIRHFQNVLTRVDARSGQDRPGPMRLHGISNVFASPVGAANRVYITDRDGATLVMSHDDHPRVLAINQLDDSFSASAALAGRELFLRGERSLYCIAEE